MAALNSKNQAEKSKESNINLSHFSPAYLVVWHPTPPQNFLQAFPFSVGPCLLMGNFSSFEYKQLDVVNGAVSFSLGCQIHVQPRGQSAGNAWHWSLRSSFESYPHTQPVSEQILRTRLVNFSPTIQQNISSKSLSRQFMKITHICDQCHILLGCRSTEPNKSMASTK